MPASAILLGPPTRATSARIVLALVATLLALLLAGRLAWYSLGGEAARPGSGDVTPERRGETGRPSAAGAAPSGAPTLAVGHEATLPAMATGAALTATRGQLLLQCASTPAGAGGRSPPLSRADLAKLQDWANLIKSNPNVRIAIRFHPVARSGGLIDSQREAAAVMRLLTEQQIDAHRLRLELSDTPVGNGAMAGAGCVIDIEATSG